MASGQQQTNNRKKPMKPMKYDSSPKIKQLPRKESEVNLILFLLPELKKYAIRYDCRRCLLAQAIRLLIGIPLGRAGDAEAAMRGLWVGKTFAFVPMKESD